MSKAKQFAKTNASNHAENHAPKAQKIDGHGHNDQGSHNYTFTFDSTLNTVQSLSRVEGTTSKALDISTSTFQVSAGLNDKGVQAALNVLQTSNDGNFSTTHLYNDTDGDGQYVETFGIHVVNNAATQLRQQTFTFNTDGTIAPAPLSQNMKGHHNGDNAPPQNGVLTKTVLDGVTYVTKTDAAPNASGYHFDVFRDDNADGVFTQIADGLSAGTNIDVATATVDLVGIQTYLAAASNIVG